MNLLRCLCFLLFLCFTAHGQAVLFSRSSAFRSFDPANYGTVGQWVEGRLQSGFANGDPVGTYTDSSGNARNFTSSGSSRPTYSTALALNGHPVLDFDGTDDWMSAGDVLDMGTGGLTVMVVCKKDSLGGFGVVCKSLAGAAVGRWWISTDASNNYGAVEQTGSSVITTDPNTSTSWALVTVVWERNVSLRIYFDGVLQDTDALSDSADYQTAYNLLLGAYNNGTDGLTPLAGTYWDGPMAGHIIWTEAMSDANREAAETAWGNGVYGLTITH